MKLLNKGFQKAGDNKANSIGDDTISNLEITNVEKQGLPSRIMVSVCSEKEGLA